MKLHMATPLLLCQAINAFTIVPQPSHRTLDTRTFAKEYEVMDGEGKINLKVRETAQQSTCCALAALSYTSSA
jgi:hypothetical protein